MKSSRGFFAALFLLLAIPIAALYQLAFGNDPEPVIHIMLALGCGLLAWSVADFKTARWTRLAGYLSTTALAALFLLQAVSELVHNARLWHLAFDVLGQRVEASLSTAFLLWCAAVLLADSHGKTRVFGALAVAFAAAVQAYATVLSLRGTSINATVPGLKLLYLMPFVWLLVESWHRPDAPVGVRTAARLAG